MAQEKYDVFISYSRKDYVDENNNVIPGNVVSTIKERLAAEGISYWFDEEGIYSGQNFVEKIVTNIEASRVFLFLSTANANASPWTCKEIASADEFKKFIIPVRIDRTPYNKKVMFRIADLNYIEYYVNPQKALDDMVDGIKAYLNQLKEEERRKQEEEERKREEERKKREEEEKLRIKLEAERKKQEEAERIQREQEEIATGIEIKCSKLNTEEEKLSLDRKNLIEQIKQIHNQERRQALKDFIESSSPIQKKHAEKIKNLQDLMKSLQNELDACTNEKSVLKKELDKEHGECVSKIAALEQIKAEQLKKDEEIKSLQGQIIALQNDFDTCTKERNTLKEENEKWIFEIDQLEKENAEHKKKDEKIIKFQNHITALTEKYNVKKELLKETEAELTKKENELKSLRNQHTTLAAENKEWVAEVERLEKLYAEQKEKEKRIKDNETKLQNELAQVRKENQTLREDSSKAKEEAQQAWSRVKSLHKVINSKEKRGIDWTSIVLFCSLLAILSNLIVPWFFPIVWPKIAIIGLTTLGFVFFGLCFNEKILLNIRVFCAFASIFAIVLSTILTIYGICGGFEENTTKESQPTTSEIVEKGKNVELTTVKVPIYNKKERKDSIPISDRQDGKNGNGDTSPHLKPN